MENQVAYKDLQEVTNLLNEETKRLEEAKLKADAAERKLMCFRRILIFFFGGKKKHHNKRS